MGTEHGPDAGEATRQVHVRTLGVVDTLRWAWDVLTDRVELVGVTFVVALLSVVASLGISPAAPGEPPEFAGWVWPTYLAYFLAVIVVWGLVYATAGDAVAERSRPLADRLTDAVGRLPALLLTAILMWSVSIVGLFLLVLPGIYVFHRLLLAYPAVVIDGQGPVEALKTSWGAGGGNVLKILAVDVCYLVLVGLSNYVASVFGQYTLGGGLVAGLGSAVLIPLFGLALGHLYLELTRNQ